MSLTQFYNCRILRNHKIIDDYLWVRDGKIVDPEKIFFDEKITPDKKIDCEGLIIAPGFIDLQINGGYGVDFSYDTGSIEKSIDLVANNILQNGVTAFCPTIVTSPISVYHDITSKVKRKHGGIHGATVLGLHVEGPFINVQKKGAHPAHHIRDLLQAYQSVELTYGNLDNISIITLAPELTNSDDVIKKIVENDIVVSLGHSIADLVQGENAVKNGATFITHLFNAMLPFHHRDPGLVGLLTSEKIERPIYYGIIADGVHTHPAALRIAYRTHPQGLVLVTDAIAALGLSDGNYRLGQLQVEVKNQTAMIADTDILCGSMCNLNICVQKLLKYTNCTKEYALEAASLHPAMVLGIEKIKGTLNYGADADFIMITDDLSVQSTWIAGQCVYNSFKYIMKDDQNSEDNISSEHILIE